MSSNWLSSNDDLTSVVHRSSGTTPSPTNNGWHTKEDFFGLHIHYLDISYAVEALKHWLLAREAKLTYDSWQVTFLGQFRPPEETLEKSLVGCSIFSWSCLEEKFRVNVSHIRYSFTYCRGLVLDLQLVCWNSTTGQRGDLFSLLHLFLLSHRGHCQVIMFPSSVHLTVQCLLALCDSKQQWVSVSHALGFTSPQRGSHLFLVEGQRAVKAGQSIYLNLYMFIYW